MGSGKQVLFCDHLFFHRTHVTLIWQLRFGNRLRLIHINTNKALHSHKGFTHPKYTSGQQEVTCFSLCNCNEKQEAKNLDEYWEIEKPYQNNKS